VAIESIGGMNKEWKFVAGTQVSPDGTKLANQGELRIKLPDNVSHKNLMGFSYAADGKDFCFYPVKIKDNTAVFALSSFSGYGVINIGDSKGSPPQPSTIEKQAKQYIAEILKDAQRDMINGSSDSIDEDHLRRIGNILKGWYNASVKVKLAEAEKNPDIVEDAAREFLSWKQVLQAVGLEDRFEAEDEASQDSLARAIKNAVDKAVEKCVKEKDPSQISRLIHLYKLAVMLGLDGREGLKVEAIKEKAIKLATFELKIDDHIRFKMPEYSEDMFHADLEGAGTVSLSLGEDFLLSGMGEFQLSKMSLHVDIPDDFPVTDILSALAYGFIQMLNGDRSDSYNETYRVNMPPTLLTMSPGAKKVVLCLDIGYVGGEDSIWLAVFNGCHASEREGNLFKISGWEVPGKGAVFARKSCSRTTQIEGTDIKEDTTFELIFTPEI